MAHVIEEYGFGYIKIDGKTYSSDVIIYPDKIESSWWRKEGHKLLLDDLPDIESYKPDVFLVGTGYHGMMDVSEEVIDYVKKLGIEIIIENTRVAWKKYNELAKDKKVIAAFHLTC